MTSRTPMGVQPRPPQRTLSGSGLAVQRPSHQRTLSQQYLPPSPVRKDNVIDLTGEANDVAATQNRYGTMPRRGGSRLKLELSNESMLAQASISESPQTITPSRMMPKSETSRLTDMSSPASAKGLPGDSDNPPMPMPKRRPRYTLPSTVRDCAPPAIATKKDGRPKPYTLEVPTAAPRYAQFGKPKESASKADYGRTGAKETSDMGHADFFPWNGNHAEDHFSESIIKQGFFDKAPVQQTETTSAKQAIFPALKHKSGLNLLSNIFVGVLSQRKHNGQITAPSTFKPPPRVTLTDTKREIWLRDLANPSISLRRLSRTIPHGIRGKVLLDHCLNKNVPTERAVWLVKCVGANEIRSFKRKGVNGTFVMGGEAKWLRDWTVFVEQFVESVSSSFGDGDWKAKVQYAIRLATHLYSEHLLDRDHYMDWLVSGLESSAHAKLPMWILITQIYWKDLLRLRRYGRRLVNALLNHLNTINNDPDRDILAQLSARLASLLTLLISSYPANFLSPTTWFKFRDALHAFLPIDNDAAQNSYNQINSRNERLVASSNNSQPEKRQILVKHLDTILQAPFNGDLASLCWNVSEEKNMIIRTVLEWCTSPYRPGQAKVYVTASLLREWASLGLDVTGSILDFLDNTAPQAKSSKISFHQLMSELVRSGHFHAQRYVLWLIAQGGLKQPMDTDPDGPCSTRLLVELPLHALSTPFKEIRASLLRRASYDVNDEAVDIEMAMKCVRLALGLPLDSEDEWLSKKPMSLGKVGKRIQSSSRTLQTEVGARILHIFNALSDTKDGFQTSSSAFNQVRSILESASDYSILAEMVRSTTRASNPDILASCADTINVHLPIFAALGQAKELFDILFQRLKAISEEHGLAARPLLASLASLAARIPELASTATHLRKELLQIDRSTAIDACSPVSDNMAGNLQDAEGELHEEIEKLLASGSSVDRPTMDRLFQTVVSRLEKCWSKTIERQRAYSALLARLRIFDPQHFDVRMTDWVHHVSILTNRPPLSEIYPLLISLGCLSIPIILTTTSIEAAKFAASASRDGYATSTYMQDVLQLILMPLTPKAAMTPEESYRFYIEPQSVLTRHQKELTVLVRNALIEYARLRALESVAIPLDNGMFEERVLDLLRLLVLNDPTSVAQIMAAKTPDSSLTDVLSDITSKLLMPNETSESPLTFEKILELANEFTLPFCQLKLSAGLSVDKNASPGGEDEAPSQFEMFTKAMDRAIEARNLMWTSMLPYLTDEITEHLKSQAQIRFFSLFPSLKNPPVSDPLSEESISMAENLLAVVEAITRGRPAPKSSQLVPAMVDKLTELWEILASGGDERQDLRAAILNQWLPALLKFVTLHTTASEPAATPTAGAAMKPPANAAANEIRSRLLIVLSGLILELDTVAPSESHSVRDLASQVLDLALVLVDNLPEDARLQCVRVLLLAGTPTAPATSDARLRYLFSYMPLPTEQFMLAHRQTTTATPAARAKIPISVAGSEKLTPFIFRRWEMLSEPTPNVGENDTSLSLTLFEAIKIQ